jgi:uncharacterized protein (DUF1697 family)
LPSYAAFLRAINTGGHKVTMERLRSLVGELGFDEVATVINSGNVLFATDETNVSELESRIENHLNDALGFESTTFVRTAAEVARIASHEPFPGGEGGDNKLHVMFLHRAPTAAVKRRVLALATAEDELAVRGREVYWLRHGPLMSATVDSDELGRILAGPTTVRTANTVRRIADKLS